MTSSCLKICLFLGFVTLFFCLPSFFSSVLCPGVLSLPSPWFLWKCPTMFCLWPFQHMAKCFLSTLWSSCLLNTILNSLGYGTIPCFKVHDFIFDLCLIPEYNYQQKCVSIDSSFWELPCRLVAPWWVTFAGWHLVCPVVPISLSRPRWGLHAKVIYSCSHALK